MRALFRTYRVLVSILLVPALGHAQKGPQPEDPSAAKALPALAQDTVAVDSTTAADSLFTIPAEQPFDTVEVVMDDGDLEGPIDYHAADSIVYDLENGFLHLFGETNLVYDRIDLSAERSTYDWNTSTLSAEGVPDSTGELSGTPVFMDGGKEYQSRRMQYNFRTGQGRSEEILTQEGEAFISSEVVKKNPYDEWYGFRTRYTTCNNHEDPHFYLQSRRSKVVPDKVMVTGPVNLHVGGVPTPLGLPFGLFPLDEQKKSGLIFPQLRYDYTINGYGVENGGYYWAVNDNLGLSLTGSAYTRGRWGVTANANYVRRYKFDGIFDVSYFRTPPNDPDLPGAKATNDFSILWNHKLSSKARPNNTFSANIDGQTSGYINNSLQTGLNSLQVNLNSNINYKRTFPGRRFSFGLNAAHRQNLVDRSISLTLPEANFILTRITPFSRPVTTAKKKWYENIGFGYTARAKAQVSTVDSLLFTEQGLKALEYGARQTAYLDYNAKIFKHFNFNPRFDASQRLYFQRTERTYDPDTTAAVVTGQDTVRGFFPLHDFDVSASLSTTLTGIFQFKGQRLNAIRHKLDPVLTYRYRPDFADPKWNVYRDVRNAEGVDLATYSPYSDISSLYGLPQQGAQNALDIELRNNIEMKVRDRKDSTKAFKKIPLLDVFTVRTGFNFAADSLKMSLLRINGSTRIGQYLRLNFNVNMDPYTANESNRRINTTALEAGQGLFRFSDANISLNGTIRAPNAQERERELRGVLSEREWLMRRFANYYDFTIPWTFTLGYNLNVRQGATGNPDSLVVATNNINIQGDFNLTPKWKVAFNTGYDIRDNEVTLTNVRVIRDLHCWRLSFDWQAYPIERQSFIIELGVVSSVLQDLKLSRRQPPNQRGF